MSIITCKVILEYDDQKSAEVIASSVSPDNEDYVELKVKGSKIECFTEAETPKKLLHTLDDFLACVTIAEENL
ncbi:MAG: KEOPS complex subunit Pcc1 [Thermoplasmatota archaeon]